MAFKVHVKKAPFADDGWSVCVDNSGTGQLWSIGTNFSQRDNAEDVARCIARAKAFDQGVDNTEVIIDEFS